MEGVDGVTVASALEQPEAHRSLMTVRLLCQLQRECAEQTLLALAALERYEQELLQTLLHEHRSHFRTAVTSHLQHRFGG
jgi:hypothetical protein